MRCIDVMVISPDPALARSLVRRLPLARFNVTDVRPGQAFVDAVHRAPPQIAVLDRIDARPEVAALELALLKRRCPRAQVIAISERSSTEDARVIEQGVFFYLAGRCRQAKCFGRELPRLIAAAETRIRSAAAGRSFNRDDKE